MIFSYSFMIFLVLVIVKFKANKKTIHYNEFNVLVTGTEHSKSSYKQ